MVSTPQNSSINPAQKIEVSSIKPETIDFFQKEINPNLTPEQIENIIGSLKPNSKPNPLIGTPINLLYLQKDDNLAAVVIQQEYTGNLFILSAESDLLNEANAIPIENLKDFKFRLQDAFNHDSLVSIYYKNNRIISLVIIKRKQNNLPIPGGVSLIVGPTSLCHAGYPFCPK